MGVGGQRHTPASLPPGMTQYPLYKRLGRPQGQSGRVLKTLPPTGFDPRTVQLVASRYTDWARCPNQNLPCISLVPHTDYMLRPSLRDLITKQCLAKSVNDNARYFAFFSSLLLHHHSWAQIYTCLPYSRTTSAYVEALNAREQISQPYKTRGFDNFLTNLCFWLTGRTVNTFYGCPPSLTLNKFWRRPRW
jgi:hypothetical protein